MTGTGPLTVRETASTLSGVLAAVSYLPEP
jgi:hypothetical protein